MRMRRYVIIRYNCWGKRTIDVCSIGIKRKSSLDQIVLNKEPEVFHLSSIEIANHIDSMSIRTIPKRLKKKKVSVAEYKTLV